MLYCENCMKLGTDTVLYHSNNGNYNMTLPMGLLHFAITELLCEECRNAKNDRALDGYCEVIFEPVRE